MMMVCQAAVFLFLLLYPRDFYGVFRGLDASRGMKCSVGILGLGWILSSFATAVAKHRKLFSSVDGVSLFFGFLV